MLRPNESILLFGVLSGRDKFGMRLPGVQPRAFAQNGSGAKDVPLVADTLWIDTERALVVVLPSPSGVGVIAVTTMYLPFGALFRRSRTDKWTLALDLP